MDFEPERYRSEGNGTTVDTARDPGEGLLHPSKGVGLANPLFRLSVPPSKPMTFPTAVDIWVVPVVTKRRSDDESRTGGHQALAQGSRPRMELGDVRQDQSVLWYLEPQGDTRVGWMDKLASGNEDEWA